MRRILTLITVALLVLTPAADASVPHPASHRHHHRSAHRKHAPKHARPSVALTADVAEAEAEAGTEEEWLSHGEPTAEEAAEIEQGMSEWSSTEGSLDPEAEAEWVTPLTDEEAAERETA